MPQIGEIKKAKEISLSGYSKYIWNGCVVCGAERWVQIRHGQPYTDICHKCAVEKRKANRSRIMRDASKVYYKEPVGSVDNPILGDIRRGTEIGLAEASGWVIWIPCNDCGKEKWQIFRITKGKPQYVICSDCANRKRRLFPKIAKGTIDEPIINDVRKAKDIGKNGSDLFIFYACERCGVPKWTATHDLYRGESKFCRRCAIRITYGRKSLEEGRLNKKGYVDLYIPKDSFFRETGQPQDGRCLEHRLVMAKHLGRNLARFEKVHHKNGIRNDNRIENLELTTAGQHTTQHNKGYRDGYTKGLADGRTSQIDELRKEIKLLRWQLKEGIVKI